jgi:hypothetical protein
MLHGKEAESEAIVGGKPGMRVSLQECPTGPLRPFADNRNAKDPASTFDKASSKTHI